MTLGKGKRPRDPNLLAKWIVDRSTAEGGREPEEVQPAAPSSPTVNLSEYVRAIGRTGGTTENVGLRQHDQKLLRRPARAQWKKR
jgi:hypothetical protein